MSYASVLSRPSSATPTQWFEVTLDNLQAAEDFLDCLERYGCPDQIMQSFGDSVFTVRWHW